MQWSFSRRFMMRPIVPGSVVWMSLVVMLTSHVQAERPTYFRSDRGLAGADDRPLPENFDEPANLVWSQPVAPGHSSPCVHGDAIYLTTFHDGKLVTLSLDKKTGAVNWSREAPAEKIEPFHATGSPASATPACDGERVYSFFGSYGVLCYDLVGKLLWQKPLGPFQDEFGAASSPVLAGDKLLLNEDHDINSFLICIDAKTGATVWQTMRPGFTRSYATPVVWERDGEPTQVIVAGALQLTSYDLQSGKPLWTVDGLARIVNATPTMDQQRLYVGSWSPGGDSDSRISMESWKDAVQKWDQNQDGKLTQKEVDNKDVLDRFFRIDLNQDQGLDQTEWEKYARVFELARNSLMAIKPTGKEASAPEIDWQIDKGIPYIASPLLYREHLFIVKEGGIVSSVDVANGRTMKQGRVRGGGNYYASPVAGDGKLYLINEAGVLSVVRAAGAWELLGSHDFAERTMATPAIVDGRIYVRTEKRLYCFAKP